MIVKAFQGGGNDLKMSKLVATYQQADGSSQIIPARYCSTVTLNSGASGSVAFCPTLMKKWGPGEMDRQMNEIALKRSGPIGKSLRLRGRGRVALIDDNADSGYASVTLMNGSIIEHMHNQNEDSGLTQIWDDRYELGKLTMVGCLVYDPQAKRYYWDFGRECTYNANGMPDCIDSPLGPCHAPCPKCGYSTKNFKQPELGDGKKVARYWAVRDVVANMRLRFVSSNIGIEMYLGHRYLSKYVDWPLGLGANMAGSGRVLSTVPMTNMSVRDALQQVVREAGPYDIFTAPKGDTYNSEIQILDMGKTIPDATYSTPDKNDSTLAECLSNALIAAEGYVSESVADYFDEYVKVGNCPVIEAMMSVNDEFGTGGEANVLNGGLEFAFIDEAAGETSAGYQSSKYFKDAMAFVKAHGDDQPGLNLAFKQFPLLVGALKVSLSANSKIWEGTKYDGFSNKGRMRFMPMNASGYNMNADNPRDFFPREIVVEAFRDYMHEGEPVSDPPPDPEHAWLWSTEYNNLALSPDSTIATMSVLRNPDGTGAGPSGWFIYSYGTDDPPPASASRDFRLRAIRMNCTVQAEWPIVGVGAGDPNGCAERVDDLSPSSYVQVAPDGDYVELLVSKYNWPRGKAFEYGIDDGTTPEQDPERDTDGNELFSDAHRILPAVANLRQKDVRRVAKSGLQRIMQIAAGAKPGVCARIDAKDGLDIVGVMKSVKFSQVGHSMSNPADKTPDTWFQFGPADWSVLSAQIASGGAATGGWGNSGTEKPNPVPKDEPSWTPDKHEQPAPGGGGGAGGGYGSSGGSAAPVSSYNGPDSAGDAPSGAGGGTGISAEKFEQNVPGAATPQADAAPPAASVPPTKVDLSGGGKLNPAEKQKAESAPGTPRRERYTGAPRPYTGPDFGIGDKTKPPSPGDIRDMERDEAYRQKYGRAPVSEGHGPAQNKPLSFSKGESTDSLKPKEAWKPHEDITVPGLSRRAPAPSAKPKPERIPDDE